MLKKVLLPEDTLTSIPNLPRQLLWRHTFFRCLIWLAQWDLADTRSISHNIKSHRILFMYVRFCKWQLSLHMDTYLSSPVSSCKSHKVNLSAAYERCTDKGQNVCIPGSHVIPILMSIPGSNVIPTVCVCLCVQNMCIWGSQVISILVFVCVQNVCKPGSHVIPILVCVFVFVYAKCVKSQDQISYLFLCVYQVRMSYLFLCVKNVCIWGWHVITIIVCACMKVCVYGSVQNQNNKCSSVCNVLDYACMKICYVCMYVYVWTNNTNTIIIA